MDSAAFLSAVYAAYVLSCILPGFAVANNIISCPTERTFHIGQQPSTSIKCNSTFSAGTSKFITWHFQSNNASTPEVELVPSEEFIFDPKEEKISLRIMNPDVSHVGQYTLNVAVPGNGTFSKVIQLNIRPWVHITNMKDSMHFYAGSDYEIECVQKIPLDNVTFSWLRDGQELNMFSYPQKIEFPDNGQMPGSGKMMIRNVSYSDRATFTCVGRGQYGNDTAKFVLRVRSSTCWLYPFGGCFALLFTLAIILGIDDWHRKRSPKREDDYLEQPSLTTSKGAKTDDSGEVKHFSEIVAANAPPRGEPAFVSYKSLRGRALHDE